jgi:hypothetical protein
VFLIIGFVIALFYNPETVILREKSKVTQNNGGHRHRISTS